MATKDKYRFVAEILIHKNETSFRPMRANCWCFFCEFKRKTFHPPVVKINKIE